MNGGSKLTSYVLDCKLKVTTYNLVSVICHHGAAGSGGHYTCYCLNEQYNQWYEFDDQCVTLVRPDTVKNCEAYVLFYRYTYDWYILLAIINNNKSNMKIRK